MTKIAIVYFSAYGRTRLIAENIYKGVETVIEEVKLFECSKVDMDYLNSCKAIIFGCPTYMGSAPAEFKKFMDSTSPIWQKQLWRNKIAAAFTNSAALSGDKLGTLNQISLFAFQHGMIWVGLDLKTMALAKDDSNIELNRLGSWIGLMTQSSSERVHLEKEFASDKKTAEYFGIRVANIAKNTNLIGE